MLSYILAEGGHVDNQKTLRIPSECLCRRIAETVEVSPEQRERLLEHLLLSREDGSKTRQRRIDREWVRETTLEELMRIVSGAYKAIIGVNLSRISELQGRKCVKLDGNGLPFLS
jgi:hypothetical protein